MGITYVDVRVANVASPDKGITLEFLVDSGIVHSVVPTGIIEGLGIKSIDEQVFRLANGDKVRRRKGGAIFKYGERIGGADVIFGEDGDANLLGALTLEALGLSLDPLKRSCASCRC